LTLDADKTLALVGDTVTFTPKYDGVPGPAGAWRWAPNDTSTHDNTACDGGTASCKKQMITPGTMWVYASAAGAGDSASKAVTVSEPPIQLSGPTSVYSGDSATFTASVASGATLAVTGWLWRAGTVSQSRVVAPRQAALARVSGATVRKGGPSFALGTVSATPSCTQTAATCTDQIIASGAMWVFGTVNGVADSATAPVSLELPTVVVACTPLSVVRAATVTCVTKLQPNTLAFTVVQKQAKLSTYTVVDTTTESKAAGDSSVWAGPAIDTSDVAVTLSVTVDGTARTLTGTGSFGVRTRGWPHFSFPTALPVWVYTRDGPFTVRAPPYPGIAVHSGGADTLLKGGLGRNVHRFYDYRNFTTDGPNQNLLYLSFPPSFSGESVFIRISLSPADSFYLLQNPATPVGTEPSPSPLSAYCVASDLDALRDRVLWHEGVIAHWLGGDHHTVNVQYYVDYDVMAIFDGAWVPNNNPNPSVVGASMDSLEDAKTVSPLKARQSVIDDPLHTPAPIDPPTCKLRKLP
jgi:hypothetical protein